VLYTGAEPGPLARALRQPDRRLRMAALVAIVRLQPSQPYPGSSYVPAALQFFSASSGRPRALAAGPNADETRELAGLLTLSGYEVDTALNGKDLLSVAARSPDYEVAMIDMAISGPEIAMLLQQLRHDERTASLRVGLIARAGYLEQAERLARQDPLALAFSRPHDEPSARWQVAQLAALAPREFVSLCWQRPTRRRASGRWSRWPAASRSRWKCAPRRPRHSGKTSRNTASC
jgi:CheY-like chemotaxis protein